MRSLKRMAAVLIIAAAVAGSAFAVDLSSFPSPISKGSLLVSPGFALAKYYSGFIYTKTSFGGTVAVDYALPIPLTVGAESGLIFAKGEEFLGYKNPNLLIIPIMGRVAWHINFEVPNLDTYILLKAGYGLGMWAGGDDPGDTDGLAGFGYGFNLGLRYFFTSSTGAFLEGGWTNYNLKGGSGYWAAYTRQFLTVGATFKLGGK